MIVPPASPHTLAIACMALPHPSPSARLAATVSAHKIRVKLAAWRPPRDRDAATTVIGGPVAALRRPPTNLTRTLCALTYFGVLAALSLLFLLVALVLTARDVTRVCRLAT